MFPNKKQGGNFFSPANITVLLFARPMDNNIVGGQEAEAFLCAHTTSKGAMIYIPGMIKHQLIKPFKTGALFLIKIT